MSLVCDNIIGIDQTCAIRGRSILDNGHLHRNIIDYCNQKNLKCAFISFDREKAFDRISHKFLFNVLEKYNFGPNLIKWIQILYNDLNSSIIINNCISKPINISRSVKQGCSLSPLLYILCLEPFIRKVYLDREIKVIQLPGSNISCKISAFADDSTGASGSKLNKTKTKGIWLGAWKDRKDNYKFGIDFVNTLKIIGFKIGNYITEVDNWNPLYIKYEKVVNLWKNRNLSLLEKSIVINALICFKIWYS